MSWEDEFADMRPETDTTGFADRSEAMLERLLGQLDDAPAPRRPRRRAPVLITVAAIAAIVVGLVALIPRSSDDAPVIAASTPQATSTVAPDPSPEPEPTPTPTPTPAPVVVPEPVDYVIPVEGVAFFAATDQPEAIDAASAFVRDLILPEAIVADDGGNPGPLTTVAVETLDPELMFPVTVAETAGGWLILRSGDEPPLLDEGVVSMTNVPDNVRHVVLYYMVGDTTAAEVIEVDQLQGGYVTPGEGVAIIAVLYDTAGLPVDIRAAS